MSVAAIAATVAGCSAGATGPRQVGLSLVAPTDGATVNVRSILVFGHVTPSDARVLVGKRWVHVRRGTFRLPLRLGRRVNHIGILAVAGGYHPASLVTTVRVSRKAASPRRSAGPPLPKLPSDFASRAQAICSASNQQLEALPHPTPQTFVPIWRQLMAIRQAENGRLVALTASAAGRPAVGAFIGDLRQKVALDATMFTDFLEGRLAAARRVVRRSIVLAPQWWVDAGRLGVPDCGAVAVPASTIIAAGGQ